MNSLSLALMKGIHLLSERRECSTWVSSPWTTPDRINDAGGTRKAGGLGEDYGMGFGRELVIPKEMKEEGGIPEGKWRSGAWRKE